MNTAPIANFSRHTEARAVIENKKAAHGTIRTVLYVLYFVIVRVQDGVHTFERIWHVESRHGVGIFQPSGVELLENYFDRLLFK